MFTVDTKEIAKLERQLIILTKKGYPEATRKTLNDVAFQTRKKAQARVVATLTLRNQFAKTSIQFDKTETLDVNQQKTTIGSIAKFMRIQEFGGIKTKKSKEGVPIATSQAAGQSKGVKRTKIIRKANLLKNVRLRKQINIVGLSRKRRIFLTIKDAIEHKSRFVFLNLGNKKGIFRVVGGTKKNTSAARLRMIANLSKSVVRIPAKPWLAPSFKEGSKLIPALYVRALQFQVRRLGLFK